MGGGVYSNDARLHRSSLMGYETKSCNEIFTQRNINNAMNPFGVTIRESRDSIEHPNSVPIVLALDVTGSMGSIPHHMVREGLPKIMGTIIQSGIPDPQLLFLGIGDHECDQSSLQVGQFESSDELLDKWLTTIWLEGGGGGNDGESYLLAWYFAAYHTITDSFEKRNKKGFLFTIGDEPVLSNITDRYLTKIMGGSQYNSNYTSVELLDKAREKYNVYHLHIKETSSGLRIKVIDGWKQLMKDNLIVVDRYQDVSKIISEIIISNTTVDIVSSVSPSLSNTEIIL